MGFNLDTNQKSQVNTPLNRRSIYDASAGEIAWKSLLAGFSLGIGQMLATFVFFGVIAGLVATWIMPVINQLNLNNLPLNDFSIILQQANPSGSSFLKTTPTPTTFPTTKGE